MTKNKQAVNKLSLQGIVLGTTEDTKNNQNLSLYSRSFQLLVGENFHWGKKKYPKGTSGGCMCG